MSTRCCRVPVVESQALQVINCKNRNVLGQIASYSSKFKMIVNDKMFQKTPKKDMNESNLLRKSHSFDGQMKLSIFPV